MLQLPSVLTEVSNIPNMNISATKLEIETNYSFTSECFTLTPLQLLSKSGIVESLLSWVDFKQSKDLKKTDGTKRQRITGITKAYDLCFLFSPVAKITSRRHNEFHENALQNIVRYGVIECDPLVRKGLERTLGATAVNLVAGEKPADVYSGIAARVLDIMRKDAQKDPEVFPDALRARLLINQVTKAISFVFQLTTGGSGSCLKRYTDPTIFRRASASSGEKTEIVKTMGHQYDHDESAEMLTMNFNQDLQEEEVANFRSIDQMDFQFDNEDTPTPISGWNQLDDIESEIDNYVDALNTIESESETDLDCQTKREVKKSSNLNEEGTQEDEVHGLAVDHSDLQPSNLESHTADFSNTNNVTSSDKPNSISSQFYANEESHQMVGESSDISNSLSINFCENDDVVDGSNVESDVVLFIKNMSAILL
ncbi:hypothetical protein LOK49_LG01G02690 [Camellia lanceoleosa]|uniref:Uncharacterized protein n=1 Tax=Camellia lanceoleosa TaxID=1840588 RepID=A0ACC0J0B1_9ERIC|nr:hypothetical protein LOK49_LG01G02690 [Camellia lanceoleosa]